MSRPEVRMLSAPATSPAGPPSDGSPEPYAADAQHAVTDAWRRFVRGREAADVAPAARRTIGQSWVRSRDAGVAIDLAAAPVRCDAEQLAARRAACRWLAGVHDAAHPFAAAPEARDAHVLALFDAEGCLLDIAGDPAAVDGLAAINFAPGARWTEGVVGTNGPGTALALGAPVHVIGAEHYCERWKDWHCAAVPVRDPLDGQVLGVVDISGAHRHAHPHTLVLAGMVALSLEHWLRARDAMRRVQLLEQLEQLARRYPGDALVAIDRAGAVVAHRGSAARHVDTGWPTAALRRTLDRQGTAPQARHVPFVLDDHAPIAGVLHPLAGGDALDGVVVLQGRTGRTPTSAPAGGRPGLALSVRRTTPYSLSDVIGTSPAIEGVRRFVQSAARSRLPVLLTGASGTGKEVVAQSIHAASSRAHEPFVAVNCAAIPRELVESELFGHVAGAFSGARRDGAVGRFEAAHRGTLFLDEIGELPPAAQAALLRALQEGEVTRLGAHEARPVDVRVIAATNRDVTQAMAEGTLREDLYYRLAVLTATMPALRDRREDVRALAHAFLRDAEAEHGMGGHDWAPAVLDALTAYDWPGNVRELRNCVRRLVALADGRLLEFALLPDAIRAGSPGARARAAASPVADGAPALPTDDAPNAALSAERLRDAIARAPTVVGAARALGVSRATLYRALERHGLVPGRGVRARP